MSGVRLMDAEMPLRSAAAQQYPIFASVRDVLMCADPEHKIRQLRALPWVEQLSTSGPAEPVPVPGRPERPELVAPRALKSRGLGTPEGRAALIHAVAHIEFNAINLAVDAMYRFRDMPAEYYRDWYRVALDESRHFQMLSARLQVLGMAYGDFPAHNGLWEAACKTADSCLARMALVPRVLEARGLDVTPGMIERLARVGDQETIAILQIILSEEVAHVAIGTRWFRFCCALQSVEPETTFLALVRAHSLSAIRPPFNETARRVAGFTATEQAGLAAIAKMATPPL
jgi:uncharacterized ferritin-like protein (DUF455 family)